MTFIAKPLCPNCYSDHFVVECRLSGRGPFYDFCTECGWESNMRGKSRLPERQKPGPTAEETSGNE